MIVNFRAPIPLLASKKDNYKNGLMQELKINAKSHDWFQFNLSFIGPPFACKCLRVMLNNV